MNLITYFNFGRLPNNSRKERLKQILMGCPNLLKRLQAPHIMEALKLKKGDSVLDFGCGSGYITFEMARQGAKAVGIDVNTYIEQVKIPTDLKDNLRFVRTSGTRLPFENNVFDVILASEVLPMIPEPEEFLKEIKRVLKKDGLLVVVNGLGFHAIKEAYEANSPMLGELKKQYGTSVPDSYKDYITKFQIAAGTAVKEFMTEQKIIDLLKENGFNVEKKEYSPGKKAGEWLAWDQFELFVSTGKVVRDNSFIMDFLKLSALSLIDGDRYQGGMILKCTNEKI